jgi:hypothetical protein
MMSEKGYWYLRMIYIIRIILVFVFVKYSCTKLF